ncbi:uncharacterized protein LOC122244972 [Penaeus japonicus]|uniref:uncharacterized protein LOC122244972 n=1 Tax=Penaeus japonicus TaxID=27405 RepID=UPI001C70F0A0|nr:uncharacterized protein LOC122244972 [Penaeus japonicus]
MNSFALLAGVALALLATQASSLFLFPLATTGTTTAAATTTSITLGTGSLAAGAAVAAAGVTGLALAALLASQGRDEEPSYHAPAPSYHAPAPSYHRRRRDVDEEKVAEMFAMVAKMDTHGCGMRLVCQLYQKAPQSLTLREKAIKLLIGDKPEPVSPKEAKQPRALYQSAAVFGVRKENCLEVYHMCPLTNEEVMQYLNTLDLELK